MRLTWRNTIYTALHTVSTLERYSNYFKARYFSKGGRPAAVSVRDLEGEFWRLVEDPAGRGLHSSTFQLNLSALYGIGGARRGRVARVTGVLRGV